MLHILEFIARRVGMMKKCVQQSGWRVNSILIGLPSCHSRISNAVICYIAASDCMREWHFKFVCKLV